MNYPYMNNNYSYAAQGAMVSQPMVSPPVSQVRTVYSEDEARNAQIPIDGNALTYVFIDSNNGRIYTKRFDYTAGGFVFEVFSKTQANNAAPEYVTRAQFDEWRQRIESALTANAREVTHNAD